MSVHVRWLLGAALAIAALFYGGLAAADVQADARHHQGRLPLAYDDGRLDVAAWSEPTPEHTCGTVLVAEQTPRGLAVVEWDLATDAALRVVVVAPNRGYRDVVMARSAGEIHIVTAFADDFEPIKHFVLDASLRMVREHEVGRGVGPSLVVEDGIVAISWLGLRGTEARLHIATYAETTLQSLGAIDVQAGDEFLTAHPGRHSTLPLLFQHGTLFALWTGEHSNRLVAYDPHRLVQLADWTSPETYGVTLGSAHGHVALLSTATLTELSDALNVVSVQAAEGAPSRAFAEDGETAAVVMSPGSVLLADGTNREIGRIFMPDRIVVFHGRVVTAVSDEESYVSWFNLRHALAATP